MNHLTLISNIILLQKKYTHIGYNFKRIWFQIIENIFEKLKKPNILSAYCQKTCNITNRSLDERVLFLRLIRLTDE